MNDLEDEREIMMYMRHEAGHAINYAYRSTRRPSGASCSVRSTVATAITTGRCRSAASTCDTWPAGTQKHPDEDFAETFAVWLTPRSNWRRKYKSWPALTKLRYVERVARRVRELDPVMPTGNIDLGVEDMKVTVEQFYRRLARQNGAAVKVAMESDLSDMFLARGRRRKNIRPAWEMVEEHRLALTDKITYWTGVRRPVVRALVEGLVRTCRELELYAVNGREPAYLVELTAYGTTLAMNKLTRGRFEHS
jgi:hypothetical protein